MLSNSLPPNKNINSINILGHYDNNMNTEVFKAEMGVGLQRESNMWAEYSSNKKNGVLLLLIFGSTKKYIFKLSSKV